MLKSPEQVLEKTKKWFEETKKEWNEYLLDKEKSFLLTLRERGDPQIPEKIKEVLNWIDEALNRDEIEGWKDFYTKWNGNPDYMSKDKYDGDKDLVGRLSDLRTFLEEWEVAFYQQKLRNGLQAVGINADDENMDEKIEEIKKVQDDLIDLGIDESKVKETIEAERKEQKQSEQGLKEIAAKLNLVVENKTPAEIKEDISQKIESISQNNEWLTVNYLGEKIKTEARIEVIKK